MQSVVSDLRSFKLSGMAFSLEERLIYAQTNKLSYREFLELLCDDEKSTRSLLSFLKLDDKYLDFSDNIKFIYPVNLL
jgi:hypothetical protein